MASCLKGVLSAGASLLWVAVALSRTTRAKNATDLPPCEALISADLTDCIILPSSPLYIPRVESYWALNARLHPWCFFLPETADELALAIRTLSYTDEGAENWNIAVRSGGHMYAGSNNIVNGITVDLGNMNASTYDTKTKLASVQTGARWRDVYRDLLNTANVTVTGGRDGDVGIGGFLLGGGNSYYTGTNGFGCDTVVNYEVVLANGSIVNANATSNSDLYKALKGGGLNFGIVTKFDLLAMPAVDLAYGQRIMSAEHTNDVLDAVVDFTDRAEQRRHDHLITIYAYQPNTDENVFLAIRVNTEGNLGTKSFNKITTIPALEDSWSRATLADAANASQIDAGQRGAGYTITLLNSPSVLRKSKLLLDEVILSLSLKIGAKNFAAQAFYQPLPSYYSQLSQANGGNVLGLDRTDFNAILWVGGVSVTSDDAAFALAQDEMSAMISKLKDFAAKESALGDFVYMNYADATQDPLRGYGPANVAFLKEVAKRYDPEEWWQRRVPGGFKISRVIL